MEWQPIETAPKDGSDVLVFFADGDDYEWYIDVACWFAGSWVDPGDVNRRWVDPPTHWMPLPEPPVKP